VWVALAAKSWRAGEHMLCGDGHFTLMYLPPEANHDNVIQAMKQQLASMLRKGHVFEGQFAGDVTCWGDCCACVSLQVHSQLHNSLRNIAQAGLSAGGRVLGKPYYKKHDFLPFVCVFEGRPVGRSDNADRHAAGIGRRVSGPGSVCRSLLV